MQKVLARSVRTPSGCREWKGATSSGYGQVVVDGQRRYAHRVTYEAVRGPIPQGLVLDHVVCDNPLCNDEWHVEPSTSRDNTLRGTSPWAANARKTRCVNGHDLTDPKNVKRVRRPTGRFERHCRACKRDWVRQYRKRKL